MIKYFLSSFKITNENIILTTPLVLFVLLFSIYLGLSQSFPQNIYVVLLSLSTIVCMLGAFFSGWFYMVKKAVDLDKREFIADEDKAKASFGLINEIPTGVGEYFLSFVGAFFLYSGLVIIFAFLVYLTAMSLVGKVDVDFVQLKAALESSAAMKSFILSLSNEQLVKLNGWYMVVLAAMMVFHFITLFWGAEIVSGTKNALFAFFNSFIFTFKNFLSTLVLFIYISFLNFIITLITSFSVINPILYFIATLIYFYFVVYFVVLIFLYYDSEKNIKAKNNCNCGAHSLGQDQLCNPESFDE